MTPPAPRPVRGLVLAGVLALAALGPAPLQAGACDPVAPAAGWPAWTAPLDHPITLETGQVALRDALDRVAAAGGFRLSYSGDDLPLDREVCLSARALPAGAALAHLLAGTGIEPFIASPRQVVLPPRAAEAPELPAAPQPVELATIVVTGTAAGQAKRPLPLALDVVDGEDLREAGGSFTEALSGAVPGLWLWPQPPTSVLADYGSIRGASSFGLSYPKVYIDGIELANPLLLTGIPPDAVERVEVIRGPQGATLYGADAISGVINIVTRQEGADPLAARLSLQSGVSLAGTAYGESPAVGQRHALRARFGSNLTGGALSIAGGSDGAYIPGASRRFVSAHGTLRHVGSGWILTGLGRVAGDAADAAPSPLLPDSSVAPRRTRGGTDQSVLEYTVGSTLKLLPSDRWTHTAALGLDGYRLRGVAEDRTPITSATDSALRAAEGGAVRASLRLGTVYHLARGRDWADLTLTGEHSILHHWSDVDSTLPVSSTRGTRSTTGGSLLASVGLRRHWFLSGGVRAEGTTDNDPVLVPMAGAAVIVGDRSVALKLRAAYGEGVRWPTSAVRTAFDFGRPGSSTLSTAGLDPEKQSGYEAGADLLLGDGVTLGVTRFDQTASGLIQRVTVLGDTSGGPGSRLSYDLENVGEISNTGWETSLAARHRGLSLRAAFTTVDSRVEQLARRYGGDLQPGDRMLEVPRRTYGITARYRTGGWGFSAGLSRAEDWIGYDRQQLAADFAAGRPARNFVGQRLRGYWRTYGGVTRLRASATRALDRHFALALSADNLLDIQTGEPDNITVVPGRSFTIGFRGAW